MRKTLQEYSKRILSYIEGQDGLKIQSGSTKKLERLIKG